MIVVRLGKISEDETRRTQDCAIDAARNVLAKARILPSQFQKVDMQIVKLSIFFALGKSSLQGANTSGSSGAGTVVKASSSVSDRNGASHSARPFRMASRTEASPMSAKNMNGLDAPNSSP